MGVHDYFIYWSIFPLTKHPIGHTIYVLGGGRMRPPGTDTQHRTADGDQAPPAERRHIMSAIDVLVIFGLLAFGFGTGFIAGRFTPHVRW